MFSIQAITLDLDDTLWEITPVIEKAEEKIYRWLSEYCPRATERFSPDDMRQIRIEVLEENPEHSHDLSELRRLAFKTLLHAVNYDETWADRAFEQFMVHRNDVELYPDALPALQSMAAVFPQTRSGRPASNQWWLSSWNTCSWPGMPPW